jgi:hypothetical protein
MLSLIKKWFKRTPASCLLEDTLPISWLANLLRLPITLSFTVSHDNPLVLPTDLLHLCVFRVLPLNLFEQSGAQLLDPSDILMLILYHGLKPVDPLLLLSDDLLEPLVFLCNQ